MHSQESLREIRSLEFAVFGGLSQEEFYSIPRPAPTPPTGQVIGYIRMNLSTREISGYDPRVPQQKIS